MHEYQIRGLFYGCWLQCRYPNRREKHGGVVRHHTSPLTLTLTLIGGPVRHTKPNAAIGNAPPIAMSGCATCDGYTVFSCDEWESYTG